MSRILITGAAGFIGSRMVERGLALHWDVISIDKKSHFKDRREHRNVPYRMIVDRDELFDFLKSSPIPEGVIHLGACTDTTNYDSPYMDKMNFEYSKNLWNFCAQKKIPFVYASSGATYGNGELGYLDDEGQIPKLKPLNPYGLSKQKFDLWALEQEKLKNTPPQWSGFKFFNVYGFGERHKYKTKMCSMVLQAYDQIRELKVKLFKSDRPGIAHGEQKRDFIFVDNVLNVLTFAIKEPLQRGIYNLGSGHARSFLDLVRAVFKAMQVPESVEFIDMPESMKNKYQYYTEAPMEKLVKAGYSIPFSSLEAGISKYIEDLQSQF